MKKISCLLLMLLLCHGLCACGGDQIAESPYEQYAKYEELFMYLEAYDYDSANAYLHHFFGMTDGNHTEDIPCPHEEIRIPAKAPTETETGLTEGKKCALCGTILLEQEVIPMLSPSSKGLVLTANGDNTYSVTGIGTCTDEIIMIPTVYEGGEVTAIGDNAFADCISITGIQIPESITHIGTRAFYGCTGLTEITIPQSVQSFGTQIFYKADNLKTVYYQTSHGGGMDNIFLNNGSIEKIVFSGEAVPEAAVRGSKTLKEVVIEDSVKTLCLQSLMDCIALTEIILPDSVTCIAGAAFAGCTGLTDMIIPDSVNQLGGSAFSDCTNLVSINIPDGVTFIDWYTFSNCTSLTSIVIPNSVTEISDRAFMGCSSLTEVILPNTIPRIGNDVFNGCKSLTSIVIPDSVVSIGVNAFYNCSSMDSITIPDSVNTIYRNAFSGCKNLKTIVFQGTVEKWSAITFEGNWISEGGYTIQCTDGTIDG